MSDDLDGFDSEHETNDEVHSNLISAVTQLEGKHRVKVSVRKEPSIEVSEFHLVKSGIGLRDAVHLGDLAASLGNQASNTLISQKIKDTIRKGGIKTLNKPLEKVEATRIDRTVRYENVQREIGRWDAVVESNRVSETLSFPLNHETVTIKDTADLVKNFKPETDLEIAMEDALKEGVVTEEVAMEEVSEFPMTLRELVQRRQELAKLRAQQSYRELKELRHSKIKSKKYHRILRKEKMKQQLKDFEILKESNPELALRQLEELDRNRAEERASLRHRNTSKWAKGKAIRAKYDTESRKVLAQQLAISKDLTQKVRKNESSDEDQPASEPLPVARGNPWVGPVGPVMDNDVELFYKSYQDYQAKQKQKTNAKSRNGGVITKSPDQPLGNQEVVDVENPVLVLNQENEVTANSDFDLEAGQETSEDDASKLVGCPAKEALVGVARGCKRKHDEGSARGGGKKKRVTVAAASGSWNVVSEIAVKSEPQPSIDALFDNIDDKFKKEVSSRMNDLRVKLQIGNGVLQVARVDGATHDNKGGSLAMKRRSLRADLDEPLSEGLSHEPSLKAQDPSLKAQEPSLKAPSAAVVGSGDVDPGKFLHVTSTRLHTRLPDELGAGVDALDDQQQRHAAITEAFADDDVVVDFAKELEQAKGEAVKPEPKEMPGWGSWVADPNEARKRQRVKKLRKRGLKTKKPQPARKHPISVFGVPIIYDKPCKELKDHLVRDLPFPFTSVSAYEASIRAPLGRTWVTEVAHRRLTAPKLVTKLGTAIKPMDEASLVKTNTLPLPRRNPLGGKQRKDIKPRS